MQHEPESGITLEMRCLPTCSNTTKGFTTSDFCIRLWATHARCNLRIYNALESNVYQKGDGHASFASDEGRDNYLTRDLPAITIMVNSNPQSVNFDLSASRQQYVKRLMQLMLVAAMLPLFTYFAAGIARKAVVAQHRAERELDVPKIEFLEASPQFKRPFRLALDRNFINERSSYYSSPALSYLDKKGLSTEKLVEKYENLWRLLEHLQLKRDFAFEEYSLRSFLTASSSEVIEAMGEKQNWLIESEGLDRYKFLSEQGLAWYLQHYYLDTATALCQIEQYGTARHLIYEALQRLQFRPIALSRYLHIPEYDRVMLLAAIFSNPVALIGNDSTVRTLLKVVHEDFPEDGKFEIEAHKFPLELRSLQKHFLGIYDLRDRNYEAAAANFSISAEVGKQFYQHDLARFMVVRSRFWGMHDKLQKRRKALSLSEVELFVSSLENDSRTIQAPNLRANVREYIALVRSDFVNKSKLMPSHQRKSPQSNKAPSLMPPPNFEVPSIKEMPDLPPLPIILPRR